MMIDDDDDDDDDDVDQPTVNAGHDKGFAGNVETPAASFSSHHLSIPVLHYFHLSPISFWILFDLFWKFRMELSKTEVVD